MWKQILEGNEMAKSELYAGILADFLDPVAFRWLGRRKKNIERDLGMAS